MQNAAVLELARHQLPYHPYYRKVFEELGLAFGDIRTVEDLRKIPFSSKADIAPSDEDPARPRQFILQPDEALIRKHASRAQLARMLGMKLLGRDVRRELEWHYKPVHTHFTTGRSAAPTPFVYSARDVQMLRETGARLFEVSGVSRDHKAISAFPYAPHLAFWLAYHALSEVGVTAVHTGGGKTMGTQKIINMIERMKPDLLVFIPGYAYHLLRTAAAMKRDFSSVKLLVFGGERVSPGLREKCQELLGFLGATNVRILTTYAFTESKTAWIQCHEESGYHLNPDVEHIELVDDEGNPVPEDTAGEVVYSGLNWRGSTVLRYRTGDMARGMNYGPCPHCGRTQPRIHFDIQRKSENKEFHLTNIRGTLVNLNVFFPMLSGMKEIEEWQVVLRRKEGDAYGMDELCVRIAAKPGIAFEDIKRNIQQAVVHELEVMPLVETVSLQTLLEDLGMETELKERRIVDKRESA